MFPFSFHIRAQNIILTSQFNPFNQCQPGSVVDKTQCQRATIFCWVCVYVGGGGGVVTGQDPPSPKGSSYRNTQEVAIIHACLTSYLLLWRLVSFRASSYCAYLNSGPSPTTLNFTMGLVLLWRVVSLQAICAYLHSAHSPTALKEWRRRWKKMQLLRDHLKVKKAIFKKFFMNIIKWPLKNTKEFFFLA